MLKTFKYRLYPTKRQERLLTEQLEELRWLWNTLLAERKIAWEERQEAVLYYDQQNALPTMKTALCPPLAQVHSLVVQDAIRRLQKAMDAFFRRLKAGENPGYPRFRGRGRYDSLTYPQWDNGVKLTASGKRLILSKIGDVKLIAHRPLEGMPKTATIRRTPTGKWFVTISCEWEPTPLPPTGQEVGIDVGLKVFAMPSVGDPLENPRFFRAEEHELGKVQRKHQVALDVHRAVRAVLTQQVKQACPDLDAHAVWTRVSQDTDEQKAWRERQRRRRIVARTHERIRWRRSDFTHQASRRLVNHYDLLVVEALSVQNMMANHALAKSIHDAAWTQFASLLACKAAWADRRLVAVNPAYTSQDCSGCGWRHPGLTLADRMFHCQNPARPDCGLVLDRDRNASLNILARGKALLNQDRQMRPMALG
jgi:putative transposase